MDTIATTVVYLANASPDSDGWTTAFWKVEIPATTPTGDEFETAFAVINEHGTHDPTEFVRMSELAVNEWLSDARPLHGGPRGENNFSDFSEHHTWPHYVGYLSTWGVPRF